MKVGGNESATKFFQSNGGSAALNSKDPKTKYTSAAATKYKEELKKRAARDAKEYACHFNALTLVLTSVSGIPRRWSSTTVLRLATVQIPPRKRKTTFSPRGADPLSRS